jgi:hypothetical protein
MGRYYSGDISGKFWFAVQSSDAADRFGSTGHQPNYIEYYFDEGDLEYVQAELKRIEDKLGDKLQVIDKFFEENNGYSDEKLEKAGIARHELREFADYGLGKKIEQCIIDNGYCEFTAEL